GKRFGPARPRVHDRRAPPGWILRIQRRVERGDRARAGLRSLCGPAVVREARRFAEAIHAEFPGKVLAYNCSPPFNWAKQLDPATIRNFQVALSGMGYRFQFVALAGFQSLNQGMFDLARGYRESGMAALTRLQQAEIELAQLSGYEAIKPQRFVGAGYFD